MISDKTARVTERQRQLGLLVALLLLGFPMDAPTHHSHAEFSDETREIEGELLSVTWRNPHPAMTLSVTTGGREESWQIQVLGNVNGLHRDGVTGERFVVGERMRITGYVSDRRDGVLLATLARFENGAATVLGPDESTGAAIYLGSTARTYLPAAEELGDLFRVWTVAERVRTADLPLRPAARAAKDAWDPLLDDPQRGCQPLGMPGAMMSPHPIEFLESGDDISLRLEEWEAVRTVHMTPAANTLNPSASPLGYSVGRWEDETLVVTTTHIDYPYMDEHGTPQSDAMAVVERFTLSADGRSLDWTATVTDPETFTEPFVAFTTRWAWVPGEALQPYDCADTDVLIDP